MKSATPINVELVSMSNPGLESHLHVSAPDLVTPAQVPRLPGVSDAASPCTCSGTPDCSGVSNTAAPCSCSGTPDRSSISDAAAPRTSSGAPDCSSVSDTAAPPAPAQVPPTLHLSLDSAAHAPAQVPPTVQVSQTCQMQQPHAPAQVPPTVHLSQMQLCPTPTQLPPTVSQMQQPPMDQYHEMQVLMLRGPYLTQPFYGRNISDSQHYPALVLSPPNINNLHGASPGFVHAVEDDLNQVNSNSNLHDETDQTSVSSMNRNVSSTQSEDLESLKERCGDCTENDLKTHAFQKAYEYDEQKRELELMRTQYTAM